jgi:hypothetical protein
MGGQPAGETDKEHRRKYRVVEEHEETFEVAPPVITSYTNSSVPSQRRVP